MHKSYQIVFWSVVGFVGLVIKNLETCSLSALVRAYIDVRQNNLETKGLFYLIVADHSPLLAEIMAGTEVGQKYGGRNWSIADLYIMP